MIARIDARLAHRRDDREQPADVSGVALKVAHERPPRRGVRAVPEGVHVARTRAGALAVAAAWTVGNKIVHRFRARRRRTPERRRDDGRAAMGVAVRDHPPNIGTNSEIGI